MEDQNQSTIKALSTRIYTNKLLALFVLRYARIREILKVRLLNKAIYSRIDEDIFWLLIYKQLTFTQQNIRVVPKLPSQFLTSFDVSLDIWKSVVRGITQSIAYMNKSPEFKKFMEVEEALRKAEGETSTAALNENTVSYNIGAYGSLGQLTKEPSQLIIENKKYDFLATFNSRFIFEGKIRFLSLVSLPSAKFFSAGNLDTFDTVLLVYDPSIEPEYRVAKVLSSEEEKEEVNKELSEEEVKEIQNRFIEILKKCKEGNMFSVLLVLNTSLIKDDADLHPIVKQYKEEGFKHPVIKIDKFGENAITQLYNTILALAEPERIQRIEYYENLREQKKKEKEEAAKEEKKQQETKKQESKKKCSIF